MRRDRIASYAKALKTTPAFIMDAPEESEAPQVEKYIPKGTMPILGCVAAGLPIFAEQNIDGYVANDFCDGEEYFALKVEGDSMTAAGIAPDMSLLCAMMDKRRAKGAISTARHEADAVRS